MSAEESKDIARRVFERGEFDLLSDDVQWRIPGTNRFAGLYDGRADLDARLLEPLAAETKEPGALIIDSLTAEEDRVAVQAHREGRTTTSGVGYDNSYLFLLRVVGGKVTEVVEYCDTELITTAFGPAAATA